ncbi:hypothetical protein AVEN_254933-1 [Araneus ventricosus]|uniref:Uncharacterized protein n=1 Tax=Araneus ventricosus TaxID=182803 RepID=A0A4Y2K5N1_ARAVE|nr:hypothetical protein AVEN_254933-1 [Araneus ventricosus]
MKLAKEDSIAASSLWEIFRRRLRSHRILSKILDISVPSGDRAIISLACSKNLCKPFFPVIRVTWKGKSISIRNTVYALLQWLYFNFSEEPGFGQHRVPDLHGHQRPARRTCHHQARALAHAGSAGREQSRRHQQHEHVGGDGGAALPPGREGETAGEGRPERRPQDRGGEGGAHQALLRRHLHTDRQAHLQAGADSEIPSSAFGQSTETTGTKQGNQSIGQYLSVHKDSFSHPPTNRRLEEAVVGDWPKMMKFKSS